MFKNSELFFASIVFRQVELFFVIDHVWGAVNIFGFFWIGTVSQLHQFHPEMLLAWVFTSSCWTLMYYLSLLLSSCSCCSCCSVTVACCDSLVVGASVSHLLHSHVDVALFHFCCGGGGILYLAVACCFCACRCSFALLQWHCLVSRFGGSCILGCRL